MRFLVTRIVLAGLVAGAVGSAQAETSGPSRSCADTLGLEKAKELAVQCRKISPATRPPCYEGNSCDLIVDEIRRGCAFSRGYGPLPDFCKTDFSKLLASGAVAQNTPSVPAPATAQVAPPSDGKWISRISAEDKKKLDGFDDVRARALTEARGGGSADDVDALNKALAGDLLSVRDGFDATGNWRCRTLKAGKGPPLAVYGWFSCRITDDGAGWRLQKLTGSQRVSGTFYDDGDKRMIFLGAGSYNDTPERRYGDDPQHNQVGYAVRPGKDRLRIEFPSPNFESLFDILELERAKR